MSITGQSDGTRVAFSRSPIKLSLTPLSETFSPPPDLGQHDEEILASLRRRLGIEPARSTGDDEDATDDCSEGDVAHGPGRRFG